MTVGYRGADIRTLPVSQPGDFPLGLGSLVGVPMSTKTDNIDWATRPGVKSILQLLKMMPNVKVTNLELI
ncbi:MAG: hypothetical protein HC849_09145 [Oscillatoriales cyanobacterium RU_3_3]|nr:hypothetical protein [Microcoleus sp. SU_5_6]NJM60307.1 hypothetical protein [Oscillatoriales cyanobacterium RU_3_3]